MRKDEVLQLLKQHKPELVLRFGIADLALFGSTVRDEAREDGDFIVATLSRQLVAEYGCGFAEIFPDEQIVYARGRQ